MYLLRYVQLVYKIVNSLTTNNKMAVVVLVKNSVNVQICLEQSSCQQKTMKNWKSSIEL